jgi:predicted nucleotidyltransferase component of viral defense system
LDPQINSREHFSVFPLEEKMFSVDSPWFVGEAKIPTYCIDELLGTKLRALYQRGKNRDLFDLWTAFETSEVDSSRLLHAFSEYMAHGEHKVSRAEFEANLFAKMSDQHFVGDITPLLPQGAQWSIHGILPTDHVMARPQRMMLN